jgi:hypothetical protein
VFRAPGETETTQGNIQVWIGLNEVDPGFQIPTREEIAVIFFIYYFHQHYLHY